MIEALRVRGLWTERERPERTAEERQAWAQQQRELERVLPDARYWRRAAVQISNELLHGLKSALVDPTLPRPDIGEIAHVEGMLTRLRGMDGALLVQEYKSWSASHPGITAGLVRAAKERERSERAALSAYLGTL